ncbi:hypothetical protein NSQ51_08180 [Geobacillus sp. FSL K6-0789]|uniref:Uncharacterized protein n=1 Tax=Geobacillus stearothermophilus TaxID=1422 RepID=A0A150MP94_GEOSE|nr:hypothetical protein [Geobacillus stearothermophilus]KOR92867.1 hypothetical protein N231_12435 [Geobacillus stearothermophilus ATCC 12980]KAF6510362.1 hypothetical protein GS8_2519 [Geobacillus stearothermophilus]KMY57972.1 hypothetical protein AA906_12455 [Geobacillus stearothermophilus]KMY60155.1 hypothetical protein AA905_10835 [Geobacillus stearothermophilus]KYD26300.1 hypothetical protein B4109_1636 [Geobacillus stearothermophilus]
MTAAKKQSAGRLSPSFYHAVYKLALTPLLFPKAMTHDQNTRRAACGKEQAVKRRTASPQKE